MCLLDGKGGLERGTAGTRVSDSGIDIQVPRGGEALLRVCGDLVEGGCTGLFGDADGLCCVLR